ncbi:Ig-like domain-containing protein [Corynebacterium meridianum]|uniref:Ig-like domain-containing protein n=1 Tax=Corynebacterium meridianum TaxID=2765363 RepID=UPI00300C7BFC
MEFSAKDSQDDPDKVVQPGDHLVFNLPGWLHTISNAVDLTNATDDVVLKCENAADAHAVTCVFTDFAETNSQDVGGRYTMLVYGVADTKIIPRSFNIGSATVNVPSILDEDVIDKGVLPRSRIRTSPR